MSASTYPVHVDARLDPGLSRWQWLFKWFLAIPHYVVLFFLWLAFVVLSVVALFAILFTGRYPRALFDFNVGVLRWTWRVSYYAYGALGTDMYPPFTLEERPDYPAHLEIDYPEHLSRGLVLVKWWLLAIPHYLVLALFLGGTGVVVNEAGSSVESPWVWSSGLIGLLVLVAAVVLLFTGRYPRPVFDFVLGMNRWALRVAAYAGLMTDEYPPFRLDQGGDDPGAAVVLSGSSPAAPSDRGMGTTTAPPPVPPGTVPPAPQAAPPTAVTPLGPPSGSGWTAGRVVGVVVASILMLVSLGLLGGGTAVLVADTAMRDDNGFVMSGDEQLTTETFALTSPNVEVYARGPADVMPDALLGDVRVTADAGEGTELFLGIARTSDVERYLGGVRHETVVDIPDDPVYFTAGDGVPTGPPGSETFWAAQSSGSGVQSLTWEIENGDWTLVVMNADAGADVSASVAVGAELPALDWLAPLLLSVGAIGLVLGAVLLTAVVRGAARS